MVREQPRTHPGLGGARSFGTGSEGVAGAGIGGGGFALELLGMGNGQTREHRRYFLGLGPPSSRCGQDRRGWFALRYRRRTRQGETLR